MGGAALQRFQSWVLRKEGYLEPGDLLWETPPPLAVPREEGGGIVCPGLSLTTPCPHCLPGRKLLRPKTQ